MKIFRCEKVYVQKNDLVYLLKSRIPIKNSILELIFSDDYLVVDDTNKYEFVMFDNKEDIEFFKNIDWIIDYDTVKDYKKEDFVSLTLEINEKQNEIANKINSMTIKEKNENVDLYYEYDLLERKTNSLIDTYWYLEGKNNYDIPFVGTNEKSYTNKEPQLKGLKKILSKIKRK